jgi:hypothetical integral membrane protein (TIGR02206 family)
MDDSFFLSSDHVGALIVSVALWAALPAAARTHPGPWTAVAARGLAVVLLGWFVAYHAVVLLDGSYSLDVDLPLHLTDAVTVVAALALLTRRAPLVELAYFWGLTASLQAVLTPGLDVEDAYPSVFYWHYFATHSGVVLAALFLTFGLEMTPRRDAVRRVFLVTLGWAAIAAIGNALTGGNYMFLTERPETASLLDYMGPWPWYIVAAAVLAIALFTLLDLPFRRRRSRPGRSGRLSSHCR